MDFKYLAIGLCVALGVFLLISELRRRHKARLLWRLAASTIAILSFYFMLYPLSYKVKKAGGTQEFNLLTAGAELGSSSNSGYAPFDIKALKGLSYSLDYQLFMSNRKAGVRYVSDLEYLLKSNPELQVVHIYGCGLSEGQLQLLKGKQLSFQPAPVPDGLIALNWNAQLKATEDLVLQGTYQHVGLKAVKLLLEGLGTRLDSITIADKGAVPFTLKASPQQAGKAVFRLIAMEGSDTLFNAAVPIEVKPSNPVKVLMLAANPDFEYKFLKNWLFEQQYPLIFRSRISKDKYSTDFLNTDINQVKTVSAGLLKKMDLLILDEEELAQLSGSELVAIKRAVEAGLGLFIRANGIKASTNIGNRIGRYASESLKNKPLNGRFVGQNTMLSPLPVEQLLFLKSGNNEQPLFQEASGKILVSTSIYGLGRQTVSVLPATYQWLLNGSDVDYSKFWAAMLNKTARPAEASQSWSIKPGIPKIGQRLNISISLPQAGTIPQFKLEGLYNSPLQNRELSTQWQLNTWASRSGWNTLSFGTATDSFYVYGPSDWQQLTDAQNRLSTTQFVKEHPIQTKVLETSILLEKTISLWWFFILLLISVSFLWYETKML